MARRVADWPVMIPAALSYDELMTLKAILSGSACYSFEALDRVVALGLAELGAAVRVTAKGLAW